MSNNKFCWSRRLPRRRGSTFRKPNRFKMAEVDVREDFPKFSEIRQRAPRQQMWGLIASAHISSASLTMYKLSGSSSPQYSLTPSSTPVHTNVCRQVHQLVHTHRGMFLRYIRTHTCTCTIHIHTLSKQYTQSIWHTHTHAHTQCENTHTNTHRHSPKAY